MRDAPVISVSCHPPPSPSRQGRGIRNPSPLAGEGRERGDENITLRDVRVMVNICHGMDMSHANLTRVSISFFAWPTAGSYL
jgi:hypothetical protein